MKRLITRIILIMTLLSAKLLAGQTIDTTRYLFDAFDQGGGALAGNCASIALIKASIACYGLDGIYEEKVIRDKLQITLKNGTQLELSSDEILTAKNNCSFDTSFYTSKSVAVADLRKAIYKRAYITYAVMIKWVMMNGDGNSTPGDDCKDSCKYQSYNSALCDLATGINSNHLYYLLGLEKYTTCTSSKKQLMDKPFGVIWRNGHTIYTSTGLYDYYSKSTSLPARWYLLFQHGFYLNKTQTTNRGSFDEFPKCH
jgi:hypothetical protein